jgi:hypothetical protein
VSKIKHDGFGVIAWKDGKRVKLYSRPGNDLTHRFPLIIEALASLRSRACIIDGEAVVCDEDGIPSFDRIRYRKHTGSVFLCAFDLIALNDGDLRRDQLRRGASTYATGRQHEGAISMDNEVFLELSANSAAQCIVVEILLSEHFKTFAPELRDDLAASVIETGKKAVLFAGRAKAEQVAELPSDLTVRTHAALEELVSRALARLA